MIVAAGLTPAWQQILLFREFHSGEVNRAEAAFWCASGKVLNVGCALHTLGVPVRTLCLVGGESGQQIRTDLRQLDVPVRWINSSVPTRACTTILDQASGKTTELVENSRAVPDEELDEYFNAFVEESETANVVVISGSLPQGTRPSYFREMLEQIQVPAVLDIRGAELELALPLKPYVVKPNREELAKTVGRDLSDEKDLVAAMAEVRDRGAVWVVVSQGSGPLLALGPEGLLQVESRSVAVRNPIGCGDCLAAGIAAGIYAKLPMRDALAIGVRAAAENATELLPARKLTRLQ